MIHFKPIVPEDKKLVTSYIFPSEQRDCDFSFTNLYGWHFTNNSCYAIIDNQLVIRFTNPEGNSEYYMPIGQGSFVHVIDQLYTGACEAGEPLCLRGVMPGTKEMLEQYYPTLFEFTTDRDFFDYLYRRRDLAELKGKNYQPKRNHVNKFKKEYNYQYLPLTRDIIPECLRFEAEWCEKHGYTENENIIAERQAMTLALNHFDELDIRGAVICVEGKVVAFTFGSPINYDTFGVHFEKADISIDGSYNIINQELALHLPEQYVYLNREEDLGLPGLRQAKHSYHPVVLLEKCKAIRTK